MIKIKKANKDDHALVVPLLKHFANPPALETIFTNHWGLEDNFFGYILTDDDRVVGFIGTIFSETVIAGDVRRFCNITTIVTDEEYRDKGAYLLMSVVGQEGCSFTNFTPTPSVRAMLLSLGFKEFNSLAHIFPPFPAITTLFAKRKWVFDHDQIKKSLTGNDLKIFEDHVKFPNCCHGVLQTHEGSCYFLANRVDKKGLPFAKIHYISNIDLFLHHLGMIRFKICLKLGSVALQLNQHLLGDNNPPWSMSFNMPSKLYKAEGLNEEQITTLYSEELLLLSKNHLFG
ncbi:MAG: GNAT family N-acetyltransferase [Magnetococcales bacterium]|nr:GNAT family N-acetyltransferase [Magnetococcales bacterium]